MYTALMQHFTTSADIRNPLTLTEAAAYLRCTTRIVQRLVENGALLARRTHPGGRPLFLRAELEEVLQPSTDRQIEFPAIGRGADAIDDGGAQ